LADQIRQMVAGVAAQKGLVRRRHELRRQAGDLKRKEQHYARGMARFVRRQKAILKQLGAASDDDFRTLAAERAQAIQLERERDLVCRQIAAGLGQHAIEDEFAVHLDGALAGTLEERWAECAGQVETHRQQLRQALEERAELTQQQRSLADDRRLAERQLELSAIDERLNEALGQWQVRAVAGLFLEKLRQDFERHRQPETLVEASTYLARLTGGHFTRVWTPLARQALLVDDRDGKTWAIDVLSRGTREQLFLSLRLALVALYARRGVELPLVLDDVLVNFDTDRARAAAEVLCEFAAEGHQLLVFTCHEHVWQMFKSLRADARRLPDHAATAPVAPAEPVMKTRRARRFQPEPAAIVEEVPEVEFEIEKAAMAELPPPTLEPVPRPLEAPSERRMPTWDEDEALLGTVEDPSEPADEIELVPPAPPIASTPSPPPAPAEPPATRRRKRVIGARGWEVELEEELKQLQRKDIDAA
jgi:hypothetical protein